MRFFEELLKGNLPPGSLVEMTWEEGQETLGFLAIPPKAEPTADSETEEPTTSES